MKKAVSILFTAMIIAPAPATYAAAPLSAEAFAVCRAVKEDTARLTCYDAISPSAIVVAKAPKVTLKDKQDAFGAANIKAREKSLAQARGEDTGDLDKMTFKVLEAGKNRAGKYFFVMENGQVWRQLPADGGKLRIPRDKNGLEVTIKRKMLGSHFLRLNGKSIRVKRIK